MNVVEKPEFKESLKLLEKSTNLLERLGISNVNIRATLAELYVANKLKKYHPQIGNERDVKSADIYLQKLNKRVEVKSSIFKEEGKYWDWGFGFKQLKNHKFDYCVLIGFDKNAKIKKTFVLTFDEINKHHRLKRKESLTGTNTYIMFSYNYMDSNEYKTKESQIELDLNLHPKKYEDRWEKIK